MRWARNSRQCQEKWGGLPDILLACVWAAQNAIGLFHEFVDEPAVRLIGVEAAGGVETEKTRCHTNPRGVGVLWSDELLLQDEDGQVVEAHSISALDYPGVGPGIVI